jgi:glycosyltransferase involved in cell wall biosynthesis
MKLKVGLIAPFPPPSAGMTVLANTLKESLEKHDVSVVKINTNIRVPKFIKALKIGQLYQYLNYYVECLKIFNNDLMIMISSSGGSFYFKIIPALFLCMLFRKKVILDFVGGGMLNKLNKTNVFLLKLFDNILVPTSIFEKAFKAKGINCSVFPHIVALDRFSSQKDHNGEVTLFSAKALINYSSIDDLIRAFAIIKKERPEAHFLIAGDGPEKENLQHLVAELDLKDVRFIGNVIYEDIPALFQSATVLIHGTEIESFGIALVEAMASGTPIVSTNVGGIPDVIQDADNGFLVDYGDYKTMAQKVLSLLNNKELYNKISENGISKSKQYGPSVLTQKLISKMNTILKN